MEYGKNLLDVTIHQDHTARVTALLPLGAKIEREESADGEEEETGGAVAEKSITIESVNGGVNYVYDEAAVEEIGWIWATEVWEDVTIPGNLLQKAKVRIKELAKGITSMELNIVDESDTGADIGSIRARQYVECYSPPHGIDGRYLCVNKTTDYLEPSGNTITIGASGVTLTSISVTQDKNLGLLESDLAGQNSQISNVADQVDQISNARMYRTELLVEGVSIFRNREQQSILHCRVYSWDQDITDTLESSRFLWHKNSGDEVADAEWNSRHAGRKSVTITTEDVQDNASFYCEVTI